MGRTIALSVPARRASRRVAPARGQPLAGGGAASSSCSRSCRRSLPTLRLRLAGRGRRGAARRSVALASRRPDSAVSSAAGRTGSLDFYDVPRCPSMHEGAAHARASCSGCSPSRLAAALAIASRRPLPRVLARRRRRLAGDARRRRRAPLGGIADPGRALSLLAALARGAAPRWPGRDRRALVLVVAAGASGTPPRSRRASCSTGSAGIPTTRRRSRSVSTSSGTRTTTASSSRTETDGAPVRAPQRRCYWRATTLDTFDGRRWREALDASSAPAAGGRCRGPALPRRGRGQRWVRRRSEIVGLTDEQLVAASRRSWSSAGRRRSASSSSPTAALARRRRPRARRRYMACGHSAAADAGQLAAAKPSYPPALDRRYRRARGVQRAAVRTPEARAGPRATDLADQLTADLSAYERSYRRPSGRRRRARAVRGGRRARDWLRSAGGFRYDERPAGHGGRAAARRLRRCGRRAATASTSPVAMALMLRWLGIPARVAAGFTSGRFRDGVWTVTDHDAHAWVEVWFAGCGWLSFDPTPGRGQLSTAYTFVVASSPRRRSGTSADAVRQARRGRARRPDFTTGGSDSPGGRPQRSLASSVLARAARPRRRAGRSALVKLVVRRSRYLARDPRRRAAAARHELADFLRDQRLDVPAVRPWPTWPPARRRARRRRAAVLGGGGRGAVRPPGRGGAAAGRARRELRDAARRDPAPLSRGERAPWLADVPVAPPRVTLRAVVMAAGLGSRLRPLTDAWPSPCCRSTAGRCSRPCSGNSPRRGCGEVDGRHRPPRRAGRGASSATARPSASPSGRCASPRRTARRTPSASPALDPPYLVAAADTVFRPGDVGPFLDAFVAEGSPGGGDRGSARRPRGDRGRGRARRAACSRRRRRPAGRARRCGRSAQPVHERLCLDRKRLRARPGVPARDRRRRTRSRRFRSVGRVT